MLIENLISFFYSVFDFFTSYIDVPSLPQELHNVFDSVAVYMGNGISLVATYTHLPYLLILFALVIAIDWALYMYRFIMWVFRKIPFLNVE